jgi:hypothetical protein
MLLLQGIGHGQLVRTIDLAMQSIFSVALLLQATVPRTALFLGGDLAKQKIRELRVKFRSTFSANSNWPVEENELRSTTVALGLSRQNSSKKHKKEA